MSTSVWDDPEIRTGGEFVRFEEVGDSVSGTITGIRTHRFDDGKVVPQVLLATDDGEERTITAGQVRLKAELAAQRPEEGDHLTVTLSEIEKRSGGKTLKHFTVAIKRGGGAGVEPGPVVGSSAPATATPVVEADAAAVAAAMANLTPEQKKTLGIG